MELHSLQDQIIQLEEEVSSYKMLFQSSELPTVIVSPGGHFIETNDAYAELMGFSNREELKG